MLAPKIFYRDFDELLEKIRQNASGKNFIDTILVEIQNNFQETLKIGSLRLYEDRGDFFVLTKIIGEQRSNSYQKKISITDEAVQKVLRNGNYIYDEAKASIAPEMRTQDDYAIPAAIVIRTPEERWIVVFELKEGWMREEVIFSLNAIRSALNQRLFADAIETELEQAAQIQRSLLPNHTPTLPGYQIAGRSQATEIVGGDLFDYFEFDDEMLGVCIGDASGHGIPAALLVRDVVIGLRMGLEKHMKMVHTLEKLNRVIYRSTYSSRFVSLFYCELEKEGHMIFVNAGHPAPFLVLGDNAADLQATGLILGAVPDITLHRAYNHMKPGAVLVLYSDGLFERENSKGELFQINRLKEVVIQNQSKSAEEIVEIVFDEVYKFGDGSNWDDDSTLVIIKRGHSDS
ncbi:MAG: PP2C family protein-serine/threonine phosphatase [bacterium]